jgi:hypothetical protein
VDEMEASFHLIHEAACSSIGFTIPDAASTDFAPDDRRRNRLKHVEQFIKING